MHRSADILKKRVLQILSENEKYGTRPFTQRELARKMGISHQALNNLLRTEVAPTTDTLDLLARALSVPPCLLIQSEPAQGHPITECHRLIGEFIRKHHK